ncbi:RNA polymerase sigma factor [Curtobacterium caseinilyticum]|uniref:Sigma factor n=1 Tax=Curtobacterium caseinilyticum TaxID=3055137 RepID=A0ABT7TTG4_9MICO|nr:sigma factor [Curtobacterium caseinilyticum]MDM7892897.1 sigma factor [Curtobacterium caseinilyticum]
MDEDAVDDVTLLRRTTAGDRDALAHLFDRYAPVLTRVAWVFAATPDEARGIVQDTFGALWDRADSLQLATASLLPWLLATCRDVAQRTVGRVPAGGDPLRWVRGTVDAMSADDRSLCERCVVDGRPYADAARDLGLTVAAVGSRGARPVQRPRKAVMRDGH